MPLIQIRRHRDRVKALTLIDLMDNLPAVTARALTCAEGGVLKAEDIMIEIEDQGALDLNCKDVSIRVWAHAFPSRVLELDNIRKRIAREVLKHLPPGCSWYVWVFLLPTSYGSDTEG